jgi:hypothetical protein
LLTAKVLERTSGADYVTLRLFLLRVFAQDIAVVTGNSFDASTATIDCSPVGHGVPVTEGHGRESRAGTVRKKLLDVSSNVVKLERAIEEDSP